MEKLEKQEWKEFVDELKKQWGTLWRDRIDDRVRAEGIADKDYSLLFVERGLVVVATRDFKPLDFVEILERHKPDDLGGGVVPPSPSVGGWGRFVRDFVRGRRRFTRRERPVSSKPERKGNLQRKKGGRGWLHARMK